MNIQLSSGLLAHRRGRFLTKLLDLQSGRNACERPRKFAEGLLLMTGEEFAASDDSRSEWAAWGRQTGNALVLLPPFSVGDLLGGLDWEIRLLPEPPSAPEAFGLARQLAPEVSYGFSGEQGASDRDAGHLWSDGSVNTRYWKKHVNSGLLVATTLPLWSISLMGAGDLVRVWLQTIFQYAGKPAKVAASSASESDAAPSKQEWAVMVCCFAYGVTTEVDLQRALRAQSIATMRLDGYDLSQIFTKLESHAWLGDKGLSDKGLVLLADGPYWRYAEQLRELYKP